MILVIKHLSVLLAALAPLLFPVQQVQADLYGGDHLYHSNNMTQRYEKVEQFALSASQSRSRIEHTLANFLLGRTIYQYLEFGGDDSPNRKNNKRLKLRLNHDHAIFVYQITFF